MVCGASVGIVPWVRRAQAVDRTREAALCRALLDPCHLRLAPLPQSHAHPLERRLPTSLFLYLASLSNLADVKDRAEDAIEEVRTPAVRMETPEAYGYSVALLFGALFLFSRSDAHADAFDWMALCSTVPFLSRSPIAGVVVVLGTLVYGDTHKLALLEGMMQSTDLLHEQSLDALVQWGRRASLVESDVLRIVYSTSSSPWPTAAMRLAGASSTSTRGCPAPGRVRCRLTSCATVRRYSLRRRRTLF